MADHRQDGPEPDDVDEILRALAEPRRRAIVRLVASTELSAGEICSAFDVTRSAVSQHLTVLKHAGLVTERREGTRRLYKANPDGFVALRRFVEEIPASSPDGGGADGAA